MSVLNLSEYGDVFSTVEGILSYPFKSKPLLFKALCHSSFANEMNLAQAGEACPNNERLEFLGDAVIGLYVAQRLMEVYPNAMEGKLSRWRSQMVSRKSLYQLAMDINLGEYLFLGKGEKRTKGAEKESILASAFEALIGALYLDGGFDYAAQFLSRIYSDTFMNLDNEHKGIHSISDYKTHLQELTQSKYRVAPIYRLVDSWGPEHEKTFKVEILIENRVFARGVGKSKKDAEQKAAFQALHLMDIKEHELRSC